MRRRSVLLSLATALVFFSALPAQARFPARPIELVVTFPAGGASDITCRALADVAPKYLGKPLVVVNKAGAGGSIGTAQVAQSKADGYTLVCALIGPNILALHMRDLPYGIDSFVPLVQIQERTMALAVSADAPWRTGPELIEDARKNPRKLRYAVSQGAAPHIMVLGLMQRAGIQLAHVPYQGDGPSITSLLGGHVEIMAAANFASLVPHMRAGTVRPLVIFDDRRLPSHPDVPTAKELGIDLVGSAWTGIAAPKGTPADVLEKLETALMSALQDEEFKARMAKIGDPVTPLGRKEFTQKWRREYEAFGDVIKAAGLGKK